MKLPLHSLRWRLQVWYGVILAIVLAAFCLTAFELAEDGQDRRIRRELFRADRALFDGLVEASAALRGPGAPPPRPEEFAEILRARPLLSAEVAERFQSDAPGFVYYSIVDTDGSVLLRSDNCPPDLVYLDAPAEGLAEDRRTRGHYAEIARASAEGIRSVLGLDIRPEREELRHLALSLGGCGVAVWVFGLLGGWWLAGRAIKPVQTIGATASRIAEGNLEERIDTAGTDSELDQLARVLNRTFERLHATFERQRRFTADAAHELRTPVTIVLAETDRLLRREHGTAEYRDGLEVCREAAQRMRRLTEALLLLARQENTPAADTPCDLGALVGDVLRQHERLAAERGVVLEPPVVEPVLCRGDATTLSILLGNLVANAIQHNRAGGHVWVAAAVAGGTVEVQVADDGPGIAPEHLPHIFERFYRADPARTGGTIHTGLGLAIAQTIARNHGATLAAENRPEGGARFTVRFAA